MSSTGKHMLTFSLKLIWIGLLNLMCACAGLHGPLQEGVCMPCTVLPQHKP